MSDWKETEQETPEPGVYVVGFWSEGGRMTICDVAPTEEGRIRWFDLLKEGPVEEMVNPPDYWFPLPPCPPSYLP